MQPFSYKKLNDAPIGNYFMKYLLLVLNHLMTAAAKHHQIPLFSFSTFSDRNNMMDMQVLS